jgi:D-lactate dehydrogenase (cytochrome)
VPFGGVVLATNKLNQLRIENAKCQAQAGVRLSEVQSAVNAQTLFYPPDPTERSCFLGGTIATNASGARTFKYGATRNYVQALKVVLASGDSVDLRRGELFASLDGRVSIPLSSGRALEAQLPTYSMPRVRKHASGYFVAPGMDLIDLFIGSEGTLGVIVEAELKLLPKPAGVLSGVVFFDNEESLLAFVREARERSLRNRVRSPTVREGNDKNNLDRIYMINRKKRGITPSILSIM